MICTYNIHIHLYNVCIYICIYLKYLIYIYNHFYIYIYILIITIYIMYLFNACRRPRSLEQSGKIENISCNIMLNIQYLSVFSHICTYVYWSYPLMVSHFRFHGDFGVLLHRSSLLTTQRLVALTLRLCQQLAIENGHRNSGFTNE